MKQVPEFTSDAEACPEQDLSDLDFGQFRPAHFELSPQEAAMLLRLPVPLLEAVKRKTAARGIPYTSYVRMLLEADMRDERQQPADTH